MVLQADYGGTLDLIGEVGVDNVDPRIEAGTSSQCRNGTPETKKLDDLQGLRNFEFQSACDNSTNQ